MSLWRSRFLERCRERGLRQTPQRAAVYDALACDRSHPTAERIHDKLRPRMPSISLATVYRVLERMQREGLVRRMHPTGTAVRYDANLEPHQHMVCRSCGSIEDVDDPALQRIQPGPQHLRGFRVEQVEIRMVGRCTRCARDP